jgi:hypothetical protein
VVLFEICRDQDDAKWICCKEARDFTKVNKNNTINDSSEQQNDYTWRQKRVHRLMDEGDEFFTKLTYIYIYIIILISRARALSLCSSFSLSLSLSLGGLLDLIKDTLR